MRRLPTDGEDFFADPLAATGSPILLHAFSGFEKIGSVAAAEVPAALR
ncbi:MAG: hypothetical protein LBS68_01315 [Puniceicoccales bacterium]|nr:hypothetical protein [Puniceicoccales bacterium]